MTKASAQQEFDLNEGIVTVSASPTKVTKNKKPK